MTVPYWPVRLWLASTPGYAAPNMVSSWRPAPVGQHLTQGWDVIAWMEACLVHTEGEWAGKPFRLLQWEKRLLLELFTLVPDEDWQPSKPGQQRVFRDGLRRKYREAFITLPKKNGKTELAAALACYLLIGDGEPSPKGVFAAGALKQAGLSFRAAQTMLLRSPVLRMLVSERDVGDLVIQVPSIAGSRMERVAAEAGTNDGPSLHFGVLDELHEWEGQRGVDVHGVITNAGAARRNSLFVSISTVGQDEDDEAQLWVQQWLRGWAAVDDPDSDPTFYFLCAQAPADTDWQDRTAWEAANPSAGATVTWAFYQQQWHKGAHWCNRYYRNRVPGQVEDAWMDADVWASCAGDVVLDRRLPVYAAVRVDHDHQVAAIAVAQRQGDKVALRAVVWPDGPLDGYVDADLLVRHALRLHTQYAAPVLAAVQSAVRRRARLVSRPGPEVTYHGAFFETSAQQLAKRGVVVVDYPHSQERLGPASETLHNLATAGLLVHDGDDVLAAHVEAVVAKQVDKGWRIVAPLGRRRITAAIAAMVAVHRAVNAPVAPSRAVRRPASRAA